MKRGFGMIQVIVMMLILSTIMTIMMKYATITSKQTQDLYLQESAQLFMNSAIEVTLFGISVTPDCWNEFHIISDDKRFFADINISTYYLSQTDYDSATCERRTLIKSEELNGMVMMDITVTSNPNHPKNTRPIRLIRHTKQRP